MPNIEETEYTFVVDEGPPVVAGMDKPIFIKCQPITQELSFLGSEGYLTIELNPGTSVDRAQEIAKYLNENVSGIGVTTF